MFNKNSKALVLLFVAILIGSIGAFGQGYMLHHELADCYPYKVVNYNFYKNIADIGIYFAPFLAIFIGFLFGLKRFWLATVVPVILCPILFFAVFILYSLVNFEANLNWRFDGKTPQTAAQAFILYAVNLSFIGGIISGICSYVLIQFTKVKKLP